MTPRGFRRALDRRARLAVILERDGNRCLWCGRQFTRLIEPTTEHLVPRLKGGPSWIENELAACRRCNGERGHRGLADWYDECDRRGWAPNLLLLREALDDLGRALDERGGHGRARGYVDAQLRRLQRREPPAPMPD